MKLGSAAFDLDDFVAKLITFMGGSQCFEDNEDDSEMEVEEDRVLDWDKIGRKALAKSRRVPVTGYMYVLCRLFVLIVFDRIYRLGPLLIEQKKRVLVKRQKQEKVQEEERRPQEIKEEDIKRSDNETTKNVLIVRKMLLEL